MIYIYLHNEYFYLCTFWSVCTSSVLYAGLLLIIEYFYTVVLLLLPELKISIHRCWVAVTLFLILSGLKCQQLNKHCVRQLVQSVKVFLKSLSWSDCSPQKTDQAPTVSTTALVHNLYNITTNDWFINTEEINVVWLQPKLQSGSEYGDDGCAQRV